LNCGQRSVFDLPAFVIRTGTRPQSRTAFTPSTGSISAATPGEIDHFCADGSNDVTHLRFQPGTNF
jgi:hypothetical protein